MTTPTRTTLLLAAITAALTVTAAEARDGGPRGGDRPDFSELDADGNGEVTLEELQALAAKRFAAADTDGDGALSADEMAAAADARQADRIARMVERLDTDGDGLVQFSEMEAMREGRRGPGAERLIERADTDGSGGLSAEEFEAARDRMADRRHGGPRDGKGPRGDGTGRDG